MSASRIKRFYNDVAVIPDEGAFAVHLDGKPVKSPLRAVLKVPTASLAEAIAGEWRAQEKHIVPESMPLTRLAFTAIDRVAPNRQAVIEQIAAYANSDAICYRATEPSELVSRQKEAWDPLLVWARDSLGVMLRTGGGIAHIVQDFESIAAIIDRLSEKTDFHLAALHALTESAGSVVTALAVSEGRIEADEGFRRAHCDELYQMEKWGSDSEAQERQDVRAEEFRKAAAFLLLLDDGVVREGPNGLS